MVKRNDWWSADEPGSENWVETLVQVQMEDSSSAWTRGWNDCWKTRENMAAPPWLTAINLVLVVTALLCALADSLADDPLIPLAGVLGLPGLAWASIAGTRLHRKEG